MFLYLDSGYEFVHKNENMRVSVCGLTLNYTMTEVEFENGMNSIFFLLVFVC